MKHRPYKLTLLQGTQIGLLYELQETDLGSEFVRAIDNCISTVGRNHLAYEPIYQQARRVFVRRCPYCLFYVVEGDTVFVIACFHTKGTNTICRRTSYAAFSSICNSANWQAI
jgi:plasmid stabilization system protein ParE